jgi:putative endonuclease
VKTRQDCGAEGEQVAAEWLQGRGYRILGRNVRTRWGEIDLIAEDGRILVFVEVKVRRDDRFGGPAAAITPAKQARLARLAQGYLAARRWGNRDCRFDVVLIHGENPKTRRIELLAGAFEVPASVSWA